MTGAEVESVLFSGLEKLDLAGGRVLVLIPDTTRTAPVGMLVKSVHHMLRELGASMDILVALGTHPPLSRDALLSHLDMTEETCASEYADMGIFNHAWDDHSALVEIGEIPRDTVDRLTDGLMSETVPVTINRRIFDYDHLLTLGPVFPHEVAGFSGGSKYLFPGISGPEMIDFFHWLGAVITNIKTIGRKDNPVRRVLNEAARLVPVTTSTISLVVADGGLVGLYVGTVEESWSAAVDQSLKLHIVRKPRRYRHVLSCAPRMYDDLWTGGKCMYKLESVVEDGGELIIYAPHIESFSYTHGNILREIGYHVRDYYLKQWERFTGVPRAVMAISTYVKGSGSYEDGIERPRIRVSLATGIPQTECERVGLGYVDPASIDLNDWRGREDEGILLVEKAGETLFLPDE